MAMKKKNVMDNDEILYVLQDTSGRKEKFKHRAATLYYIYPMSTA